VTGAGRRTGPHSEFELHRYPSASPIRFRQVRAPLGLCTPTQAAARPEPTRPFRLSVSRVGCLSATVAFRRLEMPVRSRSIPISRERGVYTISVSREKPSVYTIQRRAPSQSQRGSLEHLDVDRARAYTISGRLFLNTTQRVFISAACVRALLSLSTLRTGEISSVTMCFSLSPL
jgi:hypothetical protein